MYCVCNVYPQPFVTLKRCTQDELPCVTSRMVHPSQMQLSMPLGMGIENQSLERIGPALSQSAHRWPQFSPRSSLLMPKMHLIMFPGNVCTTHWSDFILVQISENGCKFCTPVRCEALINLI